ncbi:DUF3106 domain-containing protein [Noviherbaspirillum cavernae]|uniref:DUF3106 domain-containing protein n=1 Tax=Noviherbaspirillum cavernae TaxID=2320862 RepID=A0A418X1Q8_9BURK|nr:DUF3106 domain-containing protein [Noviherbaspirillum cavernae]RJG06389.1 DUF3106 domain-containing protein [Noviherbaspirillum cavernae]
MAHNVFPAVSRRLRAACALGALSTVAALAFAAPDNLPAATGEGGPAKSIVAPEINPAPIHATAKQQRASKPFWTDLTPVQQQALMPLAGEWDKLEPARKTKWLAIGNKFASMTPDEQQRVQERMREWLKLTPEQRRIARESYSRAKKLNPDQKSAEWEQYQQLSDEQKKKLAADAASKKRVTTLPPPSQAKAKTVPPIKSTPKPVLERSVNPQAARQAALQPDTK